MGSAKIRKLRILKIRRKGRQTWRKTTIMGNSSVEKRVKTRCTGTKREKKKRKMMRGWMKIKKLPVKRRELKKRKRREVKYRLSRKMISMKRLVMLS